MPQTVQFWRGRLPHWEIADGKYFVTLRLANSLPYALMQEIAALGRRCSSNVIDSCETSRQIFQKMEAWLDHHRELDWLTRPAVASTIADTLAGYQERGAIEIHEYVVMPNHLHLFICMKDQPLSSFMESFKRLAARRANRQLERQGNRFWQYEWFDHWSCSPHEDERIGRYIRNNPVKAGLVNRSEDWPFGSWSRSRPE